MEHQEQQTLVVAVDLLDLVAVEPEQLAVLVVFHHLVVVLTQVYLVDLLLLDLVLQLLQQPVAEAADQKMVTLHPVAALVLVDLTVHLAVVETRTNSYLINKTLEDLLL